MQSINIIQNGEKKRENLKRQLVDILRKKEFVRTLWGEMAPWLTTVITILGALAPIAYSSLESISKLQHEVLAEIDMKNAALETLKSIMTNFETIGRFYGVIIMISMVYMLVTAFMKWKYEKQCNFLYDFIEVITSTSTRTKFEDTRESAFCANSEERQNDTL